jgi:hypothetical protein
MLLFSAILNVVVIQPQVKLKWISRDKRINGRLPTFDWTDYLYNNALRVLKAILSDLNISLRCYISLDNSNNQETHRNGKWGK